MTRGDFLEEVNNFTPLPGTGNDVSGALNAIRDYGKYIFENFWKNYSFPGFSTTYGWRSNNQIPSILVVVTDDLLTQDHYSSFLDVQGEFITFPVNPILAKFNPGLFQIKRSESLQ